MHNPFSSRSAMGIRKRMLLLLLIIFVPFLLLEMHVFFNWFAERKQMEMQANLELARAGAKNFEVFLQGLVRDELAIGLALTSSRPMSEADRDHLLIALQTGYPAIQSISWIDPQGRVIASSNRQLVGFNFQDRSYFTPLLAGKEWVVSDLFVGRSNQKPTFVVSRAFRSEDGQLRGAVAASIDPMRLDEVLGVARRADAGVSLVDAGGMHVYRYPPTKFSWEQRKWLKHYPILQKALEGREVTAVLTSERTGKVRLAAFVPVGFAGWVVTCSRAEEDITAVIIRTLLPQVALTALLTLAAFGAAIGFSRPITGSIRKLREHIATLGRGESTGIEIDAGPRELKEFAATLNEMTEKIRLREQALRESEYRYRVIGETIPYGVWQTDAAGNCIYVSDSFQEMTGLSLSELSAYGWVELLPSADQEPAREHWLACVRTGEDYQRELRLRAHDGATRFVLAVGRPLRNDYGMITGWVGINLDISELKLSKERLRESEERYRSFFEHSMDAVLLTGPEGNVLSANTAACEMFSRAEEEWPFVAGNALVDRADPRLEAAMAEQFRTGVFRGELTYLRKDRSRFPGEVTSAVYQGPQGQLLTSMIIRDVSERKRAERELNDSRERIKASLAEKEVLLKEIHHRVKNNMQVISSLVDLQAEEVADPDMHTIFRDIVFRVRSMAMVHEKLYQSTDLARVDFGDYTESLLGFLWRAQGVPENGIQLDLQLQPVYLAVNTAVPCGLILNELVNNALKHAFAGRGSGRVIVSLQSVEQGRVCLHVRDDGIGLPPQFDWRTAPSLGLRLVMMLTQQLNGDMECKSGNGTEFILSFQTGGTIDD